jgi:hypothetical protein
MTTAKAKRDETRPAFIDCTDAEYHGLTALSASGAKLILKSAAHFQASKLIPQEPTEAMEHGTLFHALTLFPDSEPPYSVKRLNWTTKEGKAEKENLEKKKLPIIDAATETRLVNMRDAVHKHPTAGKLVRDIKHAEYGLTWRDAEFNIPLKAKIDGWITADMLRENCIIVDLKTTKDASPDGFARSIVNFGYHIQAAFYCEAIQLHTDKPAAFFFVAVESQPPHNVMVYELDPFALQAGAAGMRRAKKLYAECLRTGIWPGYGDGIHTLALPSWAPRYGETLQVKNQDWGAAKASAPPAAPTADKPADKPAPAPAASDSDDWA